MYLLSELEILNILLSLIISGRLENKFPLPLFKFNDFMPRETEK